jgi:ATP-dependent exoDNAse (exonuclease V) beta subunit
MQNNKNTSCKMQNKNKIKILKASAGSGKTYAIAKEFIKEALTKNSAREFRHILAVTFTKDATGEMKNRVLSELYGLAFNTEDSIGFLQDVMSEMKKVNQNVTEKMTRERAKKLLSVIINEYSRLNITTIDSFFQKILRSIARELGAGSKFNIEMNSAQVRLNAVNSMIENSHNDPQLLEWLTAYVESKLEENGNWHFRDELYRFSACIYDERFQEKEKELKCLLNSNENAITDTLKQHKLTVKKCRDFFQYANKHAIQIATEAGISTENFFHKGIVFNFWKNLSENKSADLNVTIKNHLDAPEKWTTKNNKQYEKITELAEKYLMPLLQQTVDTLKQYKTSKLILQNLHQLGLVWYITREIEKQNHENNRFMLSDTSMFINSMIDKQDAPFIYEKTGDNVQHILIDEFQDTSRLQWENFRTLLFEIIASNRFSLLVGDAKQSIYRWRNGDWRILDRIDEELEAIPETLPLNFRSCKEIVDFNNKFFTETGKLLDEKYRSELISLNDKSPFATVYEEKYVVQTARKTAGKGYVRINLLQKEDSKNFNDTVIEALILQLQTLHNANVPAGKICILTRKNSEIAELATRLSSVKNDFPELAEKNYLNIVSDDAFNLSSSEAVIAIINALRVIDNPSLAYLSPSLQLTENLSMMPLLELVSYLFRKLDLVKIQGQSSYMFTFLDTIMDYLKTSPTADLHTFLTCWNEELSTKTIPAGTGIDGVRAMTIHKSKGLQFHTVIIPFCTWELNPKSNSLIWCSAKPGVYDLPLLPISFSSKMENTVFSKEYESEKSLSWLDNLNLLYVAFTRSECNLIVFGKFKKSLSGIKNLSSVSDLLQWTVPILNGQIDAETLHYEFGELEHGQDEQFSTAITGTNILKQALLPKTVEYVSCDFEEGKSIFKQSNMSRKFVNPEMSTKEKYVAYGNIMHSLFARIRTKDDIERAVESLITEGLILAPDKETYIEKIHSAITKAGVEDWFSDKYKIYSEFSILVEENGEVTTKRPDRAIISDDETIIVDYKFGEPHAAHRRQLQQYVDLLKTMDYPDVKGYLWYVELEKVYKIDEIQD